MSVLVENGRLITLADDEDTGEAPVGQVYIDGDSIEGVGAGVPVRVPPRQRRQGGSHARANREHSIRCNGRFTTIDEQAAQAQAEQACRDLFDRAGLHSRACLHSRAGLHSEVNQK